MPNLNLSSSPGCDDGADLEAQDSGNSLALSGSGRVKVLVLDTSALVMGLNPSALDLPTYSVPSVMDELLPDTMAHTRFATSQDSGHLAVKRPTGASMKTVRETSSRVGDAGVLSRADIDVLALALDLRESGLWPAIVSDDYAVQNVSEALGVEHASLSTFGITSKFDWVHYCPACFRRYRVEDAEGTCRVCGTSLRRRVRRKEQVAKKISPSSK